MVDAEVWSLSSHHVQVLLKAASALHDASLSLPKFPSFSRHGGDGLMVGLEVLRGLFQP